MSATKLQTRKTASARQQVLEHRISAVRSIISKHPTTLEAHNINSEKFAGVLAEILTTNPNLLNCEEKSFNRAIVRCIQDGLLPDGKQAVMYPTKGNEIIYLPMKEGLCRIIHRALGGQISSGHAREGDFIEYVEDESGPRVNFKKSFRSLGQDAPPLLAAWATLIITGDGQQHRYVKVLDAVAIQSVKSCSRAGTSPTPTSPAPPWVRWESSMAEKAALNSLMRSLSYLVKKDNLGNTVDAKSTALINVVDNDPEYVEEVTPLETNPVAKKPVQATEQVVPVDAYEEAKNNNPIEGVATNKLTTQGIDPERGIGPSPF